MQQESVVQSEFIHISLYHKALHWEAGLRRAEGKLNGHGSFCPKQDFKKKTSDLLSTESWQSDILRLCGFKWDQSQSAKVLQLCKRASDNAPWIKLPEGTDWLAQIMQTKARWFASVNLLKFCVCVCLNYSLLGLWPFGRPTLLTQVHRISLAFFLLSEQVRLSPRPRCGINARF